jgi:folate-binding protein YgfZ
MVTNDVARLAPHPAHSGCHALLLTPKGRIAADLHVSCHAEELWLELARDAVPDVMQRLDAFLIADDVTLTDASEAHRHFAIEGPRAHEVLARAAGAPAALARNDCARLALGGVDAVVAAWGVSGEVAYQLMVPPTDAERLREAIFAAAEDDVVVGDAATLEVLRIEAGTPRLGHELGLDVLPGETNLMGRAVSLSKGCYTGQEIVARMESRGAASHRLVGIALESDDAVTSGAVVAGAEVSVDDAEVGEVTSVCHSDLVGPIALGFVRRALAEPGQVVVVSGVGGRVTALPFVATSS